MRSSDKTTDDAHRRFERIESARSRLGALADTLASPRCTMEKRTAAQEAVAAILGETGAGRWVTAVVTDTVTHDLRQ